MKKMKLSLSWFLIFKICAKTIARSEVGENQIGVATSIGVKLFKNCWNWTYFLKGATPVDKRGGQSELTRWGSVKLQQILTVHHSWLIIPSSKSSCWFQVATGRQSHVCEDMWPSGQFVWPIFLFEHHFFTYNYFNTLWLWIRRNRYPFWETSVIWILSDYVLVTKRHV